MCGGCDEALAGLRPARLAPNTQRALSHSLTGERFDLDIFKIVTASYEPTE